MPFFPTEWSKNSNYMFNSEIFMDKHYPEEFEEYDEERHAAVYRVPQVSQALAKAMT